MYSVALVVSVRRRVVLLEASSKSSSAFSLQRTKLGTGYTPGNLGKVMVNREGVDKNSVYRAVAESKDKLGFQGQLGESF